MSLVELIIDDIGIITLFAFFVTYVWFTWRLHKQQDVIHDMQRRIVQLEKVIGNLLDEGDK